MFRTTCLRIINSLELLGIIILLAGVLTSIAFSAKADRDPSIKQQSLVYSHLSSARNPHQPFTRPIK